jgi:hypothetical protein
MPPRNQPFASHSSRVFRSLEGIRQHILLSVGHKGTTGRKHLQYRKVFVLLFWFRHQQPAPRSGSHARKTNSWSVWAIQLKMDGSLWQAGLLPFFVTWEWHYCSHLIPFYDGIPFVAHCIGSFLPVPHPLPRSCTSLIQASRPSTFCMGYYHWNLESDSSSQIHCTTSSRSGIVWHLLENPTFKYFLKSSPPGRWKCAVTESQRRSLSRSETKPI